MNGPTLLSMWLSARQMRALALALGAAGCGGGHAGSHGSSELEEVKRTLAGDQQTELVVDWPTQTRRQLETAMGQGVVLLRFAEGSYEPIPGCFPAWTYQYRGYVVSQESARIRNSGQDEAGLPIAGARLGTSEEAGGSASIELHTAGRFELPEAPATATIGDGVCRTATHAIVAADTGAFVLRRGAASASDDGIDVAAVSATSRRQREAESTVREGDLAACSAASPADTHPPARCGSVLRIVLEQISTAETTEQTADDRDEEDLLGALPGTWHESQHERSEDGMLVVIDVDRTFRADGTSVATGKVSLSGVAEKRHVDLQYDLQFDSRWTLDGRMLRETIVGGSLTLSRATVNGQVVAKRKLPALEAVLALPDEWIKAGEASDYTIRDFTERSMSLEAGGKVTVWERR